MALASSTLFGSSAHSDDHPASATNSSKTIMRLGSEIKILRVFLSAGMRVLCLPERVAPAVITQKNADSTSGMVLSVRDKHDRETCCHHDGCCN
jgi:hypothetical protein